MKYAIGTVVGAALLGLAKSNLLGSKNDGVTVTSIDELLRYANDPKLAPLVTTVDLFDKNLTTLPPEIWKLKNLEVLSSGGNKLTTLPHEIGNLTSLKRLGLQNNELTTIPPEIGNLTSLKSLYLERNQLTTLPPKIWKLKNLEWLDLSDNQLTTIPLQIGNLTNLRLLFLSGNPDLKITLNFVVDMLNTYQNTKLATILSQYIHQQTIPARQTIRMR